MVKSQHYSCFIVSVAARHSKGAEIIWHKCTLNAQQLTLHWLRVEIFIFPHCTCRKLLPPSLPTLSFTSTTPIITLKSIFLTTISHTKKKHFSSFFSIDLTRQICYTTILNIRRLQVKSMLDQMFILEQTMDYFGVLRYFLYLSVLSSLCWC